MTSVNIVVWITRLSTVDWLYFKTQTLLATLRVSHSSAESEIISLDAGLRMDGLPALDLWDIVIEVVAGQKTIQKAQRNSNRRRLEI